MDNWPKVAIIVPGWNGWRDTIECLESLQRITYPNYQIIVVDNGSTDDSLERIKAWARGELTVESKIFAYDPSSKPVHWIEYNCSTAERISMTGQQNKIAGIPSNRKLVILLTDRNLGFSGGNNVGILYALRTEAQYIWLLNNDTVVDSKSLNHLVRTAEEDSRTGLLCPKILYYDQPSTLWYGGGNINYIRLWPQHWWVGCNDNPLKGLRDVTFINGAAMFVRRQCIEDIGLMEEKFFLRMEDVEYSHKALLHGWHGKLI